MTGKKISELQALTTLTGEEELPVAINGDNRKVTSSLLVEEIKTAHSSLLTRVNDYMYDMSGLLGKLAYRDGVGTDEKNIQGDGYFNLNGILVQASGGGFVYQKSEVDPSKIYHIKQGNGIYSSVSILVLFDENDEIIQIIPYDYPTVDFDKYFIFKGVKSIGVSFIKSQIDNPKFVRFESFDIQDLTTVLNTQQGNRALYVAAGAVYNQNTGFYELNGLTDITEEEMKTIYLQTHGAQRMYNRNNVFESARTIRTNLPFISYFGIGLDGKFRCAFLNCAALKIACVTSSIAYAADVSYMFEGCPKLKKIIGQLDIRNITSNVNVTRMFYQCGLLEDVRISSLKVNISFAYSPLISLESLQYLITNAANTSPITVTVHADVYAKIQDETQTEWHALIASAQEKNITFATV